MFWFLTKDGRRIHKIEKEINQVHNKYGIQMKKIDDDFSKQDIDKFDNEQKVEFEKNKREASSKLSKKINAEIEKKFDEINIINTNKIMKDVKKYNLDLPSYRNINIWHYSRFCVCKYLIDKAQRELSREIRKEQREELKLRIQWIALLASVTIGLIGAMIGLISVVKN